MKFEQKCLVRRGIRGTIIVYRGAKVLLAGGGSTNPKLIVISAGGSFNADVCKGSGIRNLNQHRGCTCRITHDAGLGEVPDYPL